MARKIRFLSIIPKAIRRSRNKSVMQSLADFAARIIKFRTRAGLGISGGSRRKLKKLKQSTINKRRKFVGLHSETSPAKSNLTMSGQLLNSIKGVGLKTKIYVKVSPSRSDGASNDDIISAQNKMGRKFLALGSVEKKEIAKEAKRFILDALKVEKNNIKNK